jgi:hypothetical protein
VVAGAAAALANNNFRWFHGRLIVQIVVRLFIGFMLFGRGSIDLTHASIYLLSRFIAC